MKKLIGLILAACMLCAGATYADDYGIISSTAEGDATMTRAEMAKAVVILSGLKGAAEASMGAVTFDDVNAQDPLSGYFFIAEQAGGC